MKKTIRALNIVSMGIYGLSFLLLIVAILFQKALVPELLNPTWEQTFVFPTNSVLYGALMLGVSILAFILSGSEKLGSWVNILLIALVVLLLGPLSSYLGHLQSSNMEQADTAVSLSYMNWLASYATCLNPIAYALFMVSGGMRITYRYMNKKIQKAL